VFGKASRPAAHVFDVLSSPPTEEDILAGLVDRLKADIWQEFEGKTASRMDIRKAMLPKWFGRVTGSHYTRAVKELEEEGRITHRSGARSNSYTKFAFRSN